MSRKDDWNEILVGETLQCGVLSRMIQAAPEPEWLQSLIDNDLFAAPPMKVKNQDMDTGLALLLVWSRENKEGLSDERLTDLTIDHTRLFVGAGQPLAPPWESVYFNEDRMIFQQQTLQVRQWYRRFDLEPEKLYQEPDDHIGLELSFLAHVAGLGIQAAEQGDDLKFDGYLQAQREFLSEHPLRWVQQWSRLAEKYAQTDFYRALAELIRGTLLSVAELLKVEMPKEVKA
jgi:putative dimethyl sulfoxide reductase chaperone